MISKSIEELLTEPNDKTLMQLAFSRVDLSFINNSTQLHNAIKSIIKTFVFLGFFDDSQKVTVKDAKTGNNKTCLDVLG